jgi:hypothetical protein
MADKNASSIVSAADRLGISTCTVREAKDFIRLCVKTGDTACLVGGTGIGKTQAVRQIAKELNAYLLPLFLAHREREDIIGVPFPNDDNSTYRFLVEEAIKKALDYDGQIIIFLDEFNRADRPVLNATFPMIEDRVFGSLPLSDRTAIVACMNPSEEGYFVNGAENDHAFRRRMSFINVVADHATWVEYATNEGAYDPDVVAFIRANPYYLDDPNARIAGKVSPCPASWEKVSRTFKTLKKAGYSREDIAKMPSVRMKLSGHIGVPAMVQCLDYVMRSDDERIYPEDFLTEKSDMALERLKVMAGSGKNDIIAEIIRGVALIIVTTTPDIKNIIRKLAKIYKVLPVDMVRSLNIEMSKQANSLGKGDYFKELSIAASKSEACRAALQDTHNAEQRIKTALAHEA